MKEGSYLIFFYSALVQSAKKEEPEVEEDEEEDTVPTTKNATKVTTDAIEDPDDSETEDEGDKDKPNGFVELIHSLFPTSWS